MGKIKKLANKAGRITQAFTEWFFLLPRTRKTLSRMGLVSVRDYVDVRVGLRLKNKDNAIDWIESFGFGLVKDPSDVYTYMLGRLGELPEFSFAPAASSGPAPSTSGTGFLTHALPSGAMFYFCPFARETLEGSVWLYQTASVMGYDFSFPEDC